MNRRYTPTPPTAMRMLRRMLVAAAVALLAPAGAAAQALSTAAGYGGGLISFGAFDAGGEAAALSLQSGWVVTLFGEGAYIAGGRLGGRVNAAFTQRPLQNADGEVRDVGAWMLDGSVVLRPVPVRPSTVVAPFLSVGGGFVRYGLGKGDALEFPEAGVVYRGSDRPRVSVVGGAGVDIIPSRIRLFDTPLGLRLEVADHVVLSSPFRTLEGERLGPLHNVRFGASLVGFGWF